MTVDERRDESPHTPLFRESGWNNILLIGGGKAIIFYPDGRVAFQHTCDRAERGVIRCAPFLRIGDGHTVVSRYPLTIIPSLLCPDCGTHGFVTDGNWRPA
jgi:hypothetical protein